MRSLRLVRELGLWDSVLLGIGFIVGSGIYLMPVLAAQQSGPWSLFAWIAAGIYTILTGLCFAELAVKIPKAGGLYAYSHKAFGDFYGFITGYAFWTGYWVTIAVETIALAMYLSFFTTLSFDVRVAISVFIALLFTVINYKGVKFGGETEDVLTIGKLIPLAVLILAGLAVFNPGGFTGSFSIPFAGSATQPLLISFFSSIILVLWAYQGVEIITVPSEEIRNARKTVPRAIIVSVASVIVLYVLIALVVLGSVQWRDFVSSQSPLADIGQKLIGGWGGVLLAFGGLVSILGAMNAVILAAARISFAMARDGLFPKFFSHIHGRHSTPDYALVAQFALVAGIILVYRDFVNLASFVVLFTLIPWFFSCAAAWKLNTPKERVLFEKPWIHAVATLLTLGLMLYLIPQYWLYAGIILAVGLAYYALSRNKNEGASARLSRRQPSLPRSSLRKESR